MLSLRKAIRRRTWLLPVLVILVLAQIQLAMACELMMAVPAQAGQQCVMHHSAPQQPDLIQKFCCQFAFAFSAAGNQCHNDQGAVVVSSLSGKLNPDFQTGSMIASLQDSFFTFHPTPLTYLPDRGSSRPGAQTYPITQRLRI